MDEKFKVASRHYSWPHWLKRYRPVGFVGHTENLILYYLARRNSVERFLR